MSSKIKVDNIADQGNNDMLVKCGSTLTIGANGDTVTLASGASQSGFGRSGSVDWVTTPKTSTFTAVNGEGYFINSGSAITMNLPAGSAGAIVAVSDYARNFATYNFTISPNGSEKIGGVAENLILKVDGQSSTFVYVDSTQGWVNIQNAEDTQTGVSPYIDATGGTTSCSGNDKIHIFTGPGTFTVNRAAVCAANNVISYLILAGGGGGGGTGPSHVGGGGGAGGFRELKSPATPYTASPLDGYSTPGNRITVTAQGYPITVGGGGAGAGEPDHGAQGSTSTAFGISSAGGGGGGSIGSPGNDPGRDGQPGGSGGGGSSQTAGSAGSGNTPPVTPAQGTNGAAGVDAPPDFGGGGGGGSTVAGAQRVNPGSAPEYVQGAGGAGATTSISGSPVTRGGGGGAGGAYTFPGTFGAGGAGGGGNGGNAPGVASRLGGDGTANTGGGGGGAAGGNPGSGEGGCRPGGDGGSGLVIIRYKAR